MANGEKDIEQQKPSDRRLGIEQKPKNQPHSMEQRVDRNSSWEYAEMDKKKKKKSLKRNLHLYFKSHPDVLILLISARIPFDSPFYLHSVTLANVLRMYSSPGSDCVPVPCDSFHWNVTYIAMLHLQCFYCITFIIVCRQRWWRRQWRLISVSSVLFIFIYLFHYSYKIHVQPDGNGLLLNTNDSGFTRMNMALNTLKRIPSRSSIHSAGRIDQSQHSIALFLKYICILVDIHTHI